jgi:hypothetical protein
MGGKSKRLKKIRILVICAMAGMTILALESLWTGFAAFQHFALGLGVFFLIFITAIIAKTVLSDD